MKKILLILLTVILSNGVWATDYYFDSEAGDDSNDGLSSGAPKQYMAALQALVTAASAGDVFYLKCGSVWRDTTLTIDSKVGTGVSPIVITSYGTGAKPKIHCYKDESGSWANTGYGWSKTLATSTPRAYFKTIINEGSDYYYIWNYLNFLLVDGEPYQMGSFPYPGADPAYWDFEEYSPDNLSYADDNDAIWVTNEVQGAQLRTIPSIGTSTPAQWIIESVGIGGSGGSRLNFVTSEWATFNGHQLCHPNAFGKAKYFITNHENINSYHGAWSFKHSTGAANIYWTAGNFNLSTVELPSKDNAIEILESSYIHIKGIEVTGAIQHTVKIWQSDHITFQDNDVKFMPYDGIWIYKCDSVNIVGNDMRYGCNVGIKNVTSENVVIKNNVLISIGIYQSMGGDRDERNYSGIIDYNRSGDVHILSNYIDSTGYNGISVLATSPIPAGSDFYVDSNNIFNSCLLLTDGGAIYVFDDVLTGVTKEIKYNIIQHTASNNDLQFYAPLNDINNQGIYIDGDGTGIEIDSNTIYGTGAALFFHASEYCDAKYNNIFDAGLSANTKVPAAYRGTSAPFGHHSDDTKSLDLKHNVIVSSSDSRYMGLWQYDTFDADGSDADSNYFYNPWNTIADNWFGRMGSTYSPVWMTPGSWTSATGFDNASDFNENGVDYSASSLEVDQLIKLVSNMSYDSVRTVYLYDITFLDYLGNVLTDSIQLSPKESKFLFRYLESGTDTYMDSIQQIGWANATVTGVVDTCDYHITVYDTTTSITADSARWYVENNLTAAYGSLTLTYSGTPTYNTTYECQGTYCIDPYYTDDFYTSTVDLGGYFEFDFCYAYFGSSTGTLIANKGFAESGWELYRTAGEGLAFITENSSGTQKNVSTSAGVIATDGAVYTIKCIVNKTDGWVSIIVNDTYITPSDSTIRTDFNTSAPIWVSSNADGNNDSWSYFDDIGAKWVDTTITYSQYDSCIVYDQWAAFDTLFCQLADTLVNVSSFAASAGCGADTSLSMPQDGAYIGFMNVDFSATIENRLFVCTELDLTNNSTVEVRIDSPDGIKIGEGNLKSSDPCAVDEIIISNISGVHDIYLVANKLTYNPIIKYAVFGYQPPITISGDKTILYLLRSADSLHGASW